MSHITITRTTGSWYKKKEGRKEARIDIIDGNKLEQHVFTRLHIHILLVVMHYRMEITDKSTRRTGMRHDEGEKTKWVGANATTGTGATAQPTAM